MHPVLLFIALLGQSPPLVVVPNWALLTHPTVQSALELSVPQTREIFVIKSACDAVLKRLSWKHSKPAPTLDNGLLVVAPPALIKFGKTLSRKKQERLGQITLQAYGPRVLQAPGVQKALGLSGADVDRISKVQATAALPYDEKVRHYATDQHVPTHTVNGAKVPVETPEIHSMHLDRDAKLTELLKQSLTQAENDRLAKMLGKPVKLD